MKIWSNLPLSLNISLSLYPQVIKILGERFGCSLNAVGYKVLPSYLRIIQGDGIDLKSIEEVRIQ